MRSVRPASRSRWSSWSEAKRCPSDARPNLTPRLVHPTDQPAPKAWFEVPDRPVGPTNGPTGAEGLVRGGPPPRLVHATDQPEPNARVGPPAAVVGPPNGPRRVERPRRAPPPPWLVHPTDHAG